jgi:XrtJ-associated TM-motif-TM protein
MNKLTRISLFTAAVLWLPTLAHAQAGCVNSPENPTAILALVGIAGGSLPWLRAKVLNRRKK